VTVQTPLRFPRPPFARPLSDFFRAFAMFLSRMSGRSVSAAFFAAFSRIFFASSSLMTMSATPAPGREDGPIGPQPRPPGRTHFSLHGGGCCTGPRSPNEPRVPTVTIMNRGRPPLTVRDVSPQIPHRSAATRCRCACGRTRPSGGGRQARGVAARRQPGRGLLAIHRRASETVANVASGYGASGRDSKVPT